jgi:hypothetical protein
MRIPGFFIGFSSNKNAAWVGRVVIYVSISILSSWGRVTGQDFGFISRADAWG